MFSHSFRLLSSTVYTVFLFVHGNPVTEIIWHVYILHIVDLKGRDYFSLVKLSSSWTFFFLFRLKDFEIKLFLYTTESHSPSHFIKSYHIFYHIFVWLSLILLKLPCKSLNVNFTVKTRKKTYLSLQCQY